MARRFSSHVMPGRARSWATVGALTAGVLTLAWLGAPGATASLRPARAPGSGHATPQVSAPVHYTLPPNVKRVCPWPPRHGRVACLLLRRTDITDTDISATDGPARAKPAGYSPANLRSAYKLPGGTAGRGETVALVDAYDDPRAEADLAVYRKQYKLPPCTTANGCFRKVNQAGRQSHYPAPDADWATEESLDIEMVSAICPNCHILLVEANSQSPGDLAASVNTAVRLGARYVSNSWGFSGDSRSFSPLTKDFDHPGVAITVAAGDSGYGTEWPATLSQVISVGGTSLLPASNSRGWDEIVWTGTGSGCAALRAKPSWQHDSGCSRRTDNDVAAIADPETGVAFYDSYLASGWGEVGGTSVSSPIIASVYALAGRPLPGTYPASYLYSARSGIFDIVGGTNKLSGGNCNPAYLCNAGPGYDGPSGVGTPDGAGAFSAPVDYVAMGDSYSSGEGVTPYYRDSNTKTNQCHRSKFGYPTLVKLPGQPLPISRMGGNSTFSFIACSGAETTGITGAAAFSRDAKERQYNEDHNTDWLQAQNLPGGLQADSDTLSSSTTLVTISVGGNDARFGDVLNGCLRLAPKLKTHCSSPDYTLVRDSVATKPKDPMPLREFEPVVIRLLELHLVRTYEAIHTAAPNAEIIVAGYPLLFPKNATRTCTVGRVLHLTFKLHPDDQNWLDDMGIKLNQSVADAVSTVRATGVNIRFVDPVAAFAGHEICSKRPWINGLKAFAPSPAGPRVPSPASFHPNKAGQAEYAKLINGCLDKPAAC
jgi:hypothetical protein